MRIYVVITHVYYEGERLLCVTTNEELAREKFTEDNKYYDYITLECCDENNENWVELDKREN